MILGCYRYGVFGSVLEEITVFCEMFLTTIDSL